MATATSFVKARFKFSDADLRVLSGPLRLRQTGSDPKPLPRRVSPESNHCKHKLQITSKKNMLIRSNQLWVSAQRGYFLLFVLK